MLICKLVHVPTEETIGYIAIDLQVLIGLVNPDTNRLTNHASYTVVPIENFGMKGIERIKDSFENLTNHTLGLQHQFTLIDHLISSVRQFFQPTDFVVINNDDDFTKAIKSKVSEMKKIEVSPWSQLLEKDKSDAEGQELPAND